MKRFYKIFTMAALLVVTATMSANAQFYYGLKAGANVSTVYASDLDPSCAAGYQGGIVLGFKIPIIKLGIETEALWVNNQIDSSSAFTNISSNSIEIPVMISVPIIPTFPLAIKAGPTFMVYNKVKADFNGVRMDLDNIKSTVGYTVGLGLNIFKVTFDLRFNGEFKKCNPFDVVGIEGVDNIYSSYGITTNTFSASVGYRF